MKHRNAEELTEAQDNALKENEKHESTTSFCSLKALINRKPCPCELVGCPRRESTK